MIDLPAGLDVLNLELPDSELPPKQRLPDADKAASIVSTLIYANQDRARIDSYVKGMLDGNPPYDNAALRRAGRAGDTNVNFREGEAMMSDAMTPFYDLFAESSTYSVIELDEDDAQKRQDWSRIVTNEFDYLVKEWTGFDWNMQAIIYDMVAYGKGFAFWPNKTTWQFRGVRQSRVLVPDQTSSDIDQIELMVVRQSCPVHELYAPIRKVGSEAKSGWNKKAVLDAISRAMPKSTADDVPVDYELLQQQLRNHDLYTTIQSATVRIAHIFVKEFNDKITHLIIEETGNVAPNQNTDQKLPKSKFLYKKIGRYDSMRQAMTPIFYDIGDGTFHSIKGLAIKLQAFIDIKNRLNCTVVDNARLSMSVLVKPTTSNAHETAALIHYGPLTVLPQNLEVQQWGLAGRMEEGLAVEATLSRKLESNLGQYRKPLMREKGNPATATQIMADTAKEASLSKGAVNRFYAQLDMLFEQMYLRAVNPNLNEDGGANSMALKFQRKCIEAGIPKAKLLKPRFIRATRNIGNGSIFLRQQTIMQTMPLVPMMNEAGRQNWLDSAIAVMAGTENVNLWNPKAQLPDSLKDEQAYAVLENHALSDGAPVLWTQTQNNAIHFGVHMKASVDALNSVSQGADPQKVLAFLNSAGQHLAIHLSQLQRDPNQKRVFMQAMQEFKELQQATLQLRQAVGQIAGQQQQAMKRQQQVMTDAQLDQIELQNKLRMQQEKTNAMIQMKREKHNQGLAIADAQAASNITLKSQQAAADVAIKARSTANVEESEK